MGQAFGQGTFCTGGLHRGATSLELYKMKLASLLPWISLAAVALAFQPDTAMLRRVYEEALTRRQRDYGSSDARTAQAARDLGLFLQQNGEAAAARRALAEAVRIDESAFGAAAPQTLEDVAALAAVSPPADAVRLLRRAAESTDPLVAGPALSTLAASRKAAGDLPGAAALLRRALTKAELVDGKDGLTVALILNALSLVVEPKEAIGFLEHAVEIDRHLLGERHPDTANAEVNLSGLLLAAGRPEEAVRMGGDGLAASEAALGSNHPRTAAAAGNLARALRARGDRAGAERLWRRALAIDKQSLGPRHSQTLKDVRSLANLLRETGREREAAVLEQEFKAGASH